MAVNPADLIAELQSRARHARIQANTQAMLRDIELQEANGRVDMLAHLRQFTDKTYDGQSLYDVGDALQARTAAAYADSLMPDLKSPWLRDRVALSYEGQIAMLETRMRDTGYGNPISVEDLGYVNRAAWLSATLLTDLIAQRAAATQANVIQSGDVVLPPSSNKIFNISNGSGGQPLHARLDIAGTMSFGGKLTVQKLSNSGFTFQSGQKFELFRALKFIGVDFAAVNKILPTPPVNTVWRANIYGDYNVASFASYVLSLAPSTGGSSLTITSVANNAALTALSEFRGSATAATGGISSVALYLRRPVVIAGVPTYQYWAQRSGVWSWSIVKTALPTVLASPGSATTTWKCLVANLPTGANLTAGDMELFARAVDGSAVPIHANLITLKMQKPLETVPPTIAIATPGNNATVASLPSISGTASDNVGVVNVALYLQRVQDGKYWNGTAWVTAPSVLATALTGSAPKTWTRASGLPSGANLTPGVYFIAARAFDAAGNGTSATRNFTKSA